MEQANVCWCIQIISLFHVVHTYKISLGKAMKIVAFFFFSFQEYIKEGGRDAWMDRQVSYKQCFHCVSSLSTQKTI